MSAAFAAKVALKPTATTQERFRGLLGMSAAFAVILALKPTATTQEQFRVMIMSAAFAAMVAPKPTATIWQEVARQAVVVFLFQPKSLRAEKLPICSTEAQAKATLHGVKPLAMAATLSRH